MFIHFPLFSPFMTFQLPIYMVIWWCPTTQYTPFFVFVPDTVDLIWFDSFHILYDSLIMFILSFSFLKQRERIHLSVRVYLCSFNIFVLAKFISVDSLWFIDRMILLVYMSENIFKMWWQILWIVSFIPLSTIIFVFLQMFYHCPGMHLNWRHFHLYQACF